MKCKIFFTVGVYFWLVTKIVHHFIIKYSSKSLCGGKLTSIGALVFSDSSNSCCFFGISLLVHFRGNESLTVSFSNSGVEASNRLSVEVFSASNVVRMRGSRSFISFSFVIWTGSLFLYPVNSAFAASCFDDRLSTLPNEKN